MPARARPALAVAVLGAALLGASLGTVVLAPRPAAAGTRASATEAAPAPTCTVPARLSKGEIVVPIVVDFGGPGDKVLVSCLATHSGDTGAQLLQQQASQLGYALPRYNESGLLCAIDGYPANGCGQQVGNQYAYWSYWHGGRSWQYANVGPGQWVVLKGDVEGWRFQPGGGASPSDPPPRAAPGATQLERPAGSRPGGTTTSSPRPAKGSASSRDAPGPVDGAGGNHDAPVPFIVGLTLAVLIGAAAFIRVRRASRRVS